MCILGVAIKVNKTFPFILVANRDELYNRPTKSAHFWAEDSSILGGKDLEKGGTWLGIKLDGNVAALTNVRERLERKGHLSRGELVKRYLQSSKNFPDELNNLSHYDGFNLLYGTIEELTYVSNRTDDTMKITSGVHILSNASLNTPWPKADYLRRGLEEISSYTSKEKIIEKAFEYLTNEIKAPMDNLPETGFEKELEHFLSPVFIRGDDYGSRSSTVILVDEYRNCTFIEKSFFPKQQEVVFNFPLSR